MVDYTQVRFAGLKYDAVDEMIFAVLSPSGEVLKKQTLKNLRAGGLGFAMDVTPGCETGHSVQAVTGKYDGSCKVTRAATDKLAELVKQHYPEFVNQPWSCSGQTRDGNDGEEAWGDTLDKMLEGLNAIIEDANS